MPISESDWLYVSYKLSLDVYVPLHREMGLCLTDSSKLTGVFRDGVREIKEKGRIDESIIAEFKARIIERFGREGLGDFQQWVKSTSVEHPAGWKEWVLLAELVGRTFYDPLKATGKIPKRKITQLQHHFDRSFFWDEDLSDQTVRVISFLGHRRLSKWDAWFCRVNHLLPVFTDDDLFSGKTDLFMGAKIAISNHRFQTGWKPLWANFTESEIDLIIRFGNDKLNAIPNVSYRLPHPSTLPAS